MSPAMTEPSKITVKHARIIFLDVDGVCNSLGSLIAFGTYSMFDPVSLGLLQNAAVEVDAYFVLSSAWRTCGDLQACQQIFASRAANVIATRMVDMTDRDHGVRGDQIGRWVAQHRPDQYVIVDDDGDMLTEQMPYFVHTDHRTGFRFREYVRLMAIFKPHDLRVRELEKVLTWKRTAVDCSEEVE